MEKHSEACGCGSCSGSSRRDFIKSAALLAGGLTVGAPAVAGVLSENDGKSTASFSRSNTVRQGKANRITLLYTADIHGQLHTHDEFFLEQGKPVYKKRGGFSVLKTMLHSLKSENPENTLIIDAGDCFQGSGVAALSKGEAIIPLINNIGYDLMLPGNWEVVYGKEMMRKDLGAYNAAKICANMFHDTKDELNGEYIFPPYWTKIMGGVKIGFIGYNDPLTPKRQSPAYSYGITFTKPELNVAKYIRLLRDYEKCSLVFLVTHMGLAQQVDLANMPYVDGTDFILGADTHERVRKPIEGKFTKVVEPGAFGSFVSKLDFVIEDGKVKDQQYALLDVDPDKYRPDVEMDALVSKVREPYKAELDKVIGKTKNTLVRYYVIENPMDNMITDALMWKLKPDIALSNGFRFCPPLVPDAKTGVAEITNDFLWSMLPVDSNARQAIVTGKQIWDWMEKELHNVFAKDPSKRFGGWVIRFKGMEVNFTSQQELGKRVNWIKVKGKPIELDKSYSVVACEREGDPEEVLCRIDNVSNPHTLDITLHVLMREYLAKFSPVSPKVEGRITATDAPGNLLSQLEGYDYEFI
jgi:5''-nucleotidase/2'',3''-cyclic phosphodiesterase and related esterases